MNKRERLNFVSNHLRDRAERPKYFHTYEPEHACAVCGWHIINEEGKCVWCGSENPKGRKK